jgi:hypothetical protein
MKKTAAAAFLTLAISLCQCTVEPVSETHIQYLKPLSGNSTPSQVLKPVANFCANDVDCDGGYCTNHNKCVQCFDSRAHCPAGSRCEDDLCIFDMACAPGVSFCKGSNSIHCDDSGEYAYLFKRCDDGSACTIGDTCGDGGICGKPLPVDCDDENICSDDWCDPASGCINMDNFLSCSDDDPCTMGDQCQKGECSSGSWDDACECQIPEDCQFLIDSDQCAATFTCVQNQCVRDPATAVICKAPLNPCLSSLCNPETGSCDIYPVEEVEEFGKPTFCDDHDPCTKSEYCQAGNCTGGKSKCADGNVCSADSCHPITGECTHTALAGKICNDFNACTANDVCKVTASGLSYCSGDKIFPPVIDDPCFECKCLPKFGIICQPIYTEECL